MPNSPHSNRMLRWGIVAVMLVVPLWLTGCGDDDTTFGDAFASLGDAFRNWFNTVF